MFTGLKEGDMIVIGGNGHLFSEYKADVDTNNRTKCMNISLQFSIR